MAASGDIADFLGIQRPNRAFPKNELISILGLRLGAAKFQQKFEKETGLLKQERMASKISSNSNSGC